HARLDDLEGDLALNGMGLLGHEDGAHAAFADLLQQLVRADDRAGCFGCRLDSADRCRLAWTRLPARGSWSGKRILQQAARLVEGLQQLVQALTQRGIAAALSVEPRRPFGRVRNLQGGYE